MAFAAKYVHTNLVAHDWRRMAKFYQEVFGCAPLLPERHYEGKWVEDVTTLSNASLQGVHLRLPGYGDSGPTLEIFEYNFTKDDSPTTANQRGFAHIAFHVDDVAAARDVVLQNGGKNLGKLHTMQVSGAGTITLAYMADPEGNIIELQHWEK